MQGKKIPRLSSDSGIKPKLSMLPLLRRGPSSIFVCVQAYVILPNKSTQDQVHLASRTHFVDLVIHDIRSQNIIPYFLNPGRPRYLFTKDYAIFSQMIVINKKFCTVINFLFKLFNIVFLFNFFSIFLSIRLFFFQQFFSLRTTFTNSSWLLFLENKISCIFQILQVFCLHGCRNIINHVDNNL